MKRDQSCVSAVSWVVTLAPLFVHGTHHAAMSDLAKKEVPSDARREIARLQRKKSEHVKNGR